MSKSHAEPIIVQCIWCGMSAVPGTPVEHIVPEAIGCPKELVLTKGEVCARCNHGLAHLDMALVGDLENVAMMSGVPRKGGRPASVSTYGNFKAESKNGHITSYLNMGPGVMQTVDGRPIPPFRGKERDVRGDVKRHGNLATISYTMEFGRSPKVARALVKMGAEFFCWMQGWKAAADVTRGSVADFVRFGKGQRPVIVGGDDDPAGYKHDFGQIGKLGDNGWFCTFRLAYFRTIIDLSPDLVAFTTFSSRLHQNLGDKGWSTLPPGAFKG